MRRKILMVLLLGVFLLGLGTPVFAENQAGTFTLDPFTGLYVFDGGQYMDSGPYYGLRGGYNFTSHLAAEAMFGYVTTESIREGDKFVGVYRYGLDALYHFNPEGSFVPYVLAGFAATQTDGPSGANPRGGRGMIDYGLGVKYFISDTVALRGDVRQAAFAEAGDRRVNMEYTVGLTFLLGAEQKAVAAMPQTPDTTRPNVVCTSPDGGVTGVAVDRNITATFSKEMNRSTITASSFIVKQESTPVSGKVTFAGTTATFIPARELEKDTIYTATIVAGVKDLSGNAMSNSYTWSFTTIPPPPLKTALIVLEDNHFEFDKAVITKEGKEILDQNIKILKENPKTRIRIAGYTSAHGTKEYNQQLSERRAEAVKNYLVKGGIAANRLVTIGFGQTRPAEYEPVPDNIYSKEAKANMRVLFEVIVK